jgi:hypothetical protein
MNWRESLRKYDYGKTRQIVVQDSNVPVSPSQPEAPSFRQDFINRGVQDISEFCQWNRRGFPWLRTAEA